MVYLQFFSTRGTKLFIRQCILIFLQYIVYDVDVISKPIFQVISHEPFISKIKLFLYVKVKKVMLVLLC